MLAKYKSAISRPSASSSLSYGLEQGCGAGKPALTMYIEPPPGGGDGGAVRQWNLQPLDDLV